MTAYFKHFGVKSNIKWSLEWSSWTRSMGWPRDDAWARFCQGWFMPLVENLKDYFAWSRFCEMWERVSEKMQAERRHARAVEESRERWQLIEHVRCTYNGMYGYVAARARRKGLGDLCRVVLVQDRHGNWLKRETARDFDEHWLVPWKREHREDQLWGAGIPQAVKLFRWEVGRAKKSERAARQRLRRQWRGLE